MGIIKKIRLKRLLKIVNNSAITRKTNKALDSLGKTGDPSAFEPIVKALRSGFTKTAATAAGALGNLGDPRAVPYLLGALCSNKPELRSASALALAKLGETQWTNLILGNESDFLRLAMSGDERVIQILINFIISSWDGEPLVQQALIKSNHPDVLRLLRNRLADPKTYHVERLLDVLGNLRDHVSLPDILKYLQSDKWEIRRSAARALGNMGDAQAAPGLISSLTDTKSIVRVAAAKALSELGEPHWMGIINEDNDDFERLGETKDPAFLQPLIKILNQLSLPEAAKGLAAMGNPEAIPHIRAALVGFHSPLRKTAAEALSLMGEPYWNDYVKGEAEDFSRLGASGRPEAIDLLINFINRHYDDYERNSDPKYISAVEALEKVCQTEVLGTLIIGLGNTENSPLARFCIVKALGNIGDPEAVDALIESFSTLYYGHDITYGDFKDRLHSDWEVIESLGKIGDKKAIPVLVKILENEKAFIRKDDLSGYRYKDSPGKLSSKALHGIQEKEEKITRIITALGRIGSVEAVAPIYKLLDFFTLPVRKLAAETLIRIAQKDFPSVTQQWNGISEKISTAHKDHDDGIDRNSISDCSHTDTFTHTDIGIGLEIPPELLTKINKSP